MQQVDYAKRINGITTTNGATEDGKPGMHLISLRTVKVKRLHAHHLYLAAMTSLSRLTPPLPSVLVNSAQFQ